MSLIRCISICTFLSSGSYRWALLLFVVAADFTSFGDVIWLPKVITQGIKIPSLQLCGLSLRLCFWHGCQAKQRFQHISAFQTWMFSTFDSGFWELYVLSGFMGGWEKKWERGGILIIKTCSFRTKSEVLALVWIWVEQNSTFHNLLFCCSCCCLWR